jgi:hypothetical protein
MTKQEAILAVENSPSSLMSREDVIRLLKNIDKGDPAVESSEDPGDAGYPDGDHTEESLRKMEEALRETIGDAVQNELENTETNELIDTFGAEFRIEHGNEIHLDEYSVSINYGNIADVVADRLVEMLLEDYIITQKK